MKTLMVDFKGVSTKTLIPEGEYLVKVLMVQIKKSEKSDHPYFAWQFEIIDGKSHIGSHIFDNTSTSPKALWRIRKRLENMGFEVPDGPMEIDPLALVDEQLMIGVGHEKYNDKLYARVIEEYPPEEWGESDGTEQKEPVDPELDDDEHDYTQGDIKGMDKEELKEIIEEYELDCKPTSSAVYKAMKKAGHAG